MARPLRVDQANTFYHCHNHGMERRKIFEDPEDCSKFLELAGVMAERFDLEIWSYVLMGNHYHVLVRTRKENLSQAMQWLGVSYATYFNVRHGRSGHLFQGRFKSFVVEEKEYVRKLVLYMHRNPLRAGLVRRLRDYPWSSYPSLAHGKKEVSWLKRKEVLALFGRSPERFRTEVQEYKNEEESLLENLRSGVYLGGEAAPEWLQKQRTRKPHREKPQKRLPARSPSLKPLLDSAREALGVSREDLEELRWPVRRRPRPMRDILIYVLWRAGDYRLSQIGEYFHVGYSTISNARVRGERLLQADKKAKQKLRGILEEP